MRICSSAPVWGQREADSSPQRAQRISPKLHPTLDTTTIHHMPPFRAQPDRRPRTRSPHPGIWLVWLLALLLPTVASGAPQKRVYRVAIDAEYAPYEFLAPNGEVRGLLPALLREIGRNSGVTFRFQAMTWPKAIAALQRGDVDLLSMIRTPERERKFLFSMPHSTIEQALFRNVRHHDITDITDISGSAVALQRHDIAVEQLAGRHDFRRVMVDSKQEGFLLLDRSTVAAFFTAEQPGLYFLRQHHLRKAELATLGLWPQPFCFATKQGNNALIALLNDGLRQLDRSGRHAALAREWLLSPPSWLERNQRVVVGVIIALLSLLLILWLWTFLLRRRIASHARDLELQASRYRLLFEANSDAIMILDEQGFEDCNTATLQLFGCQEKKEFLNKHPAELSPPTQPDGTDSFTLAQQRIATAFKEGSLQFEWIHRRLDGSDFHASVSLNVIPAGDRPKLQATVRDVTELVHARKLRELRQQMMEGLLMRPKSDLGETMQQIVLQIEAEMPDAICSVLLLDKQNKLRHCAAPSLPPEYCAAIDGVTIGPQVGSCGTAAYYAQRVVVDDIANDPLWQDARDLAACHELAACWSQPFFDDHYRVLGTFAVYYREPRSPQPFDLELIDLATEISSLALMRHRHMRERARAFAIIETSSDFIGMADGEGNAIYINPAGRRLIGIGEEEDVTNLKLRDFHPPEDLQRLQNEGFPRLIAGDTYQTEIIFLHRNGEEIPTIAAFNVQKRADGSVESFSVIARDTRKEQQQRARLEHTQRLESLGVLAGGIAHDFNNILTAIMGNAAMAEHKIDDHPEAARGFLRNIVTSSEKAAELCKQMLAYSGRGKFIIKPLNLSQLVREITNLLEVSIAKSVVLKYRLADRLPYVEADAAQMQQVIMNLVINAAEAIGDASGVITIETGVMQADTDYLRETLASDRISEGEFVFLEVTDTGCGMDKETQRRIFEPFFTTKFTGRGLGMSAVLGIVRGHHGALRLYSEPGQGTSFKMLLPSSAHTDENTERSEHDNETDWQGNGTILIVDDEPSIRESATMMLEDAGFQTLVAEDGQEGVDLFQAHHQEIQAVLLDMTMPRMDGRACYDAMRQIDPEARILLSSGYSEQESIAQFDDGGLAGFIQKPYTPDRLIAAIKQVLPTEHHE